jgi:hypothetical protein
MFGLGISCLATGLVLVWLRRFGFWEFNAQRAVELRKSMIEESKRRGDEAKAKKLAREMLVIEKRLPTYAMFLIIMGFSLMVVGAMLHFTRSTVSLNSFRVFRVFSG